MRTPEIDRMVAKLVREEETRNPFILASRFKIPIIFTFLIDIRGYCLTEMGQSIIVISDNLPEYVSEFVCGHELGHILEEHCINRIFMDSRTYMVPGKYENEADRFACQLLYSEPPLYCDTALSDWQLSECLNVSKINLDSRLMEMGIHYQSTIT